MEKPLLKKKSRKIRCTQEFNQLDRTSLATPSSKSEPEKNSMTKKNKNLSYLPKIYFDDEPVKENCSPNINENIKKSKKKIRAFDKQSLESTEMKVRYTSGTSTEDDKRDSEIEFKKKKKRRKERKQTEPKHVSSPDVIFGNETQIMYTNKTSVVKNTPAKSSPIDFDSSKSTMTPQANVKVGSRDNDRKTRNSVLKVDKPVNGCISKSMRKEHTARESRNSISKAYKSFSDPTSQCPISISVEYNTRKSKNAASKAHQSNVHTSESLALTPFSSDEISDDVFGENVNNDTLELFSDTKYKDDQDNSDEKICMFDISGLSVAKESNHSIKSVNPDGKRSVRFTTQPADRRSKSLDDFHNMSNRKSTVMTPVKVGSSIKPTKSFSSSNKRSVSFASVDYRRSKTLHEDSKIFPKSPYISRASKTSSLISKDVTSNCNISKSESSDESDYLQDESSPIVPQKRKSTINFDKKSVSFFTPVSNNKNKSKMSFKKSPFIPRSTLDQSFNSSVASCSNSPNNETFELTSPTIELEMLKNKNVLTSSLSEKNNGTFSLKKSIINLVTPSPVPNETKRIDSFSLSLQNLLSATDEMSKTAGSFRDSKSDSEMKVTKRKRWNKSLGVSIMDSEGILHDISSPWGKETNDFLFVMEHNYSRNSFLSPIKKIDPVKKSVSAGCGSTNKHMSTKKIQEELDKSLDIIHPKTIIAETLGTTFSPIKNESPKKPFQIQPKPSTSKLENKVVVKRTKLPNFALIHQRAFDKLEDVREMSQRKAARAQQLLSGKKPGADTNMKLPPSNLKIKTPTLKIKSPKSRKLLRYSHQKRQSPEKIQIIKSPASTITVIKLQTKITPSTSNSKKISKPLQKKLIKSNIPKPLNVDKKPLSKLGFKVGPGGNNNKASREDLKAAANKTQPKKNTLESRRNVLQNVRTNRRFELLMKMRNKKD